MLFIPFYSSGIIILIDDSVFFLANATVAVFVILAFSGGIIALLLEVRIHAHLSIICMYPPLSTGNKRLVKLVGTCQDTRQTFKNNSACHSFARHDAGTNCQHTHGDPVCISQLPVWPTNDDAHDAAPGHERDYHR